MHEREKESRAEARKGAVRLRQHQMFDAVKKAVEKVSLRSER